MDVAQHEEQLAAEHEPSAEQHREHDRRDGGRGQP